MAKYIVFEEECPRAPRAGDHYRCNADEIAFRAHNEPDVDKRIYPILRRLTDEEVDALVTPKPADDERERFVRECAMRFMVGLTGDVDECVAEAMHAAESLAARLWEKRA